MPASCNAQIIDLHMVCCYFQPANQKRITLVVTTASMV